MQRRKLWVRESSGSSSHGKTRVAVEPRYPWRFSGPEGRDLRLTRSPGTRRLDNLMLVSGPKCSSLAEHRRVFFQAVVERKARGRARSSASERRRGEASLQTSGQLRNPNPEMKVLAGRSD
eukprot:scaffold149_cov315-Pinguiococcus_pyrenoidosus.AAC.124